MRIPEAPAPAPAPAPVCSLLLVSCTYRYVDYSYCTICIDSSFEDVVESGSIMVESCGEWVANTPTVLYRYGMDTGMIR